MTSLTRREIKQIELKFQCVQYRLKARRERKGKEERERERGDRRGDLRQTHA